MDSYQEQPSTFAQPITSITTSTKRAYDGNSLQPQKKTRFTRAERRQFAKEKRVLQQAQHQKPSHLHKKGSKGQSSSPVKNCNDIDDVIAYLVSIRGRTSDRNVIGSLNRVTKCLALESRVTKSTPTKERTTKQIEKRQKHNEIRAEKRKAWQEKKAAVKVAKESAKNETVEELATGSATASTPFFPQQQTLPDFDEINFDEL